MMSGTYIALVDLRLDVHAGLGRHEERRRRPVEEGVRLHVHVGLLHSIAELLQVQLGLYGHMFAALDGLGRVTPRLLFGATSSQRSLSLLLLTLHLDRIWLCGLLSVIYY